ncbi:MAG: Efflux transporter periplasmic adaptor subunit [Candidatus Hydrogenedentes bacterium]|nr:Efflux transporter periplasmic adaptor subunit [Candidatus Hydrogenedentota bacterium]
MKMNCRPVRWLVMSAAVLACGCSAKQETAGKAAEEVRRVPVVLTSVETRAFEDRFVGQGNLQAKNFAMVPALMPGTVEALFVDEGDTVVANETKLFQTDALKLQKALEISQQDVAVAGQALKEKEANLERVQADFDKADLDYNRFVRLREENAVTQDAFEQQESRHKQVSAVLKHAHTLVQLGKEQVQQAEAALAISQKNLKDSLVVAPLTGVVSMKMKEVNEMAEVGKPIFRIEDPTLIEVSAFVPAQFYPRVTVGQTPMRVRVYGVEAGEYPLSYKAPTINPQLRTFEVKCEIANPPENVVSGAMAEIALLLEEREALGVPANAIQLRAGKSVVFAIENDMARMIEIQPGIQTDGWVELKGEPLPKGAGVVTMGQFLLQEGTPVTIQQNSAAPAAGQEAP